jgi:hypothetical protein
MSLDNQQYSPYDYSYISSNIPYKFTDYNSQSTDALNIYKGLGDINKNFRHVLWGAGNGTDKYFGGDKYRILFSKDSLDNMSKQITKRLTGVHPDGKNIILPIATVSSVAESMYENNNQMSLAVLQDMTVNYIVNQIRTEFDTIQTNNKLSLWVTKYDTDSNLQRVNGIKLNNKSIRGSASWMTY